MKSEEQIIDDVAFLSVSLSKARKSIEGAIEELNRKKKEHVKLENSRSNPEDAQYAEGYYNNKREELIQIEHEVFTKTQVLLGKYKKALQVESDSAIKSVENEAKTLIKVVNNELDKLPI